jgi:hypothetical protein
MYELDTFMMFVGYGLVFVLLLLLFVSPAALLRKHRHRRGVSGQIFFGPVGDNMSKGIVHADDASISATIVIKDKQGNLVTPKVAPQWSMGDSSVATQVVSDDGTTATYSAPFTLGTSTIDVLVDGSDMEDGNPAHGTGELQVLASGGVSLDVTFGPPA